MDITIGFAMEKYNIISSLVQVDECLGQKFPQVRKSNSHFKKIQNFQDFQNFKKFLKFSKNFKKTKNVKKCKKFRP